jgi:hypothetical protein
MRKRKIITVAVAGILIFAAAGAGAKALESPPGFTVDGKAVTFTEDLGLPYLSETGYTMMPVRACLESIGCYVEWDAETKTVFASNAKASVSIPIGKTEVTINGQPVSTDAAAVIKDGKTYLPLRAVLEAYGYRVDWDKKAGVVYATSPEKLAPSPYNINGGTTGVFSRRQLEFSGFSGIEGDITLPTVTLIDRRECPYVYFGFDWAGDAGNAEGGFQLSSDPNDPTQHYWEVFLRQGQSWQWGGDNFLKMGSTHHLKFYSDAVSDTQTDLVVELDGREVVRKASAVTDFSGASAKTVIAMAMSDAFDGTNCRSISKGAKIENLKVLEYGAEQYTDFDGYNLYSEWKPAAGKGGMWFGTAECIPSWLHYGEDGSVSIYNERLPYEQKALPTAVTEREYNVPGNVTVTDQYIYYEDEKGQIIQAQLADPTVMKAVYQLPVWTYGNGEYVYGSLSVENGTAYLKYHQGGAVMGADFLIRLNDDGTTEELQSDYYEVKVLSDKIFTRWIGPMPGPGNLALRTADGESIKIGSSEYLYNWDYKNSGSIFGPDDVYLVGDKLFIIAYTYNLDEETLIRNPGIPGIYRIDINTGETVRVSDREIREFVLEGDFLYYEQEGIFYRQSIGDGKEERIGIAKPSILVGPPDDENANPDHAANLSGVENFLVLNGEIYWQNEADHGLYDIDGRKINSSSMLSGYRTSVLDSMDIMGDSGEYLVCTFEEGGPAYKLMVFDKEGNVVFSSYDKSYCRNISISGDRIYFYDQTTGTVCIAGLSAGTGGL